MQDSSPLFLKVARLGRCHGVCEISVASRLAISVFPYFSLFLTSDDFICFLHHIYISQICLSRCTIHGNYICFCQKFNWYYSKILVDIRRHWH